MFGTDGARNGLSSAQAGELSRRIADLTGAGLPLSAGLAALSEELPRGRLRRSMTELADALDSGVPLAAAVEIQQERIPPHLRGLVIAGVRSGRLGDILLRFSTYTGFANDLKRRLVLSLAYPLLTLAIAIALSIFVSTFVVAQFEHIFRDFNLPLAGLVRMVISVAHVINVACLPVGAVAAVLIFVVLAARLFLKPASQRSLSTQLPLLGWIWAPTRHSEFCRLLALLLESRSPLPEALRLTGEGIQDSGMERACGIMANEVESGRSFALAMSKLRRFPPGLPRLLGWAEKKMTLPEVLQLAGALFETQARSQATLVGMIVTVACVLNVLALAMIIPVLFLPLITLISALSG